VERIANPSQLETVFRCIVGWEPHLCNWRRRIAIEHGCEGCTDLRGSSCRQKDRKMRYKKMSRALIRISSTKLLKAPATLANKFKVLS
jgi:hypothetical protein